MPKFDLRKKRDGEEWVARIIARAEGHNDHDGMYWERFIGSARLLLHEAVIEPKAVGEREIIPAHTSGRDHICAEDEDGWICLTSFVDGEQQGQIDLQALCAHRLGEWLIERAKQAGETGKNDCTVENGPRK
jgi:hypothetical protein